MRIRMMEMWGRVVWWSVFALLAGIPKQVVGQEGIAPPCEQESSLVCPVSLGCYDSEKICDSYDDCGTGFDEADCPQLATQADLCSSVQQNASAVDSSCVDIAQITRAGIGGEDFIQDGVANFQLPEFSPAWIQSIRFDRVMFPVETSVLYFMFQITTFNSRTDQISGQTTLTTMQEVDLSQTVHILDLRAPLFIDPLLTNSVNVSILYTQMAPTVTNPYVTQRFLSLDAVSVYYAKYSEGCGQISEECLQASSDFFQNLDRSLIAGVSCLPRERAIFLTDLYRECVSTQTELPVEVSTELASSGPPTTPTLVVIAPPCDEEDLLCPVSRGCYAPSESCDSYDDCGTGFDELDCPRLEEAADLCQSVQQDASAVDETCIFSYQLRRAGLGGADFTVGGVANFPLPQSSPAWIHSLIIDPYLFPVEDAQNLYLLLEITTFNSQSGEITHQETLASVETIVIEQTNQYPVDLRAPLLLSSSTDSVNVTVLYSVGEPSASNPYITPPILSLNALYVNYTQYFDSCEQFSPGCLDAAWAFQQNYDAASADGVTCLPPERAEFISGLYDTCFRSPEIVYITSNRTVSPGESVILLCAASGVPIPTVEWVSEVSLKVSSYQSSNNAMIVEARYTLPEAGDISFECKASNGVGEVSDYTAIRGLDAGCVEKGEALVAFQNQNLSSPCPSVTEIGNNEWALPDLGFTLPTTGLLYSVDIPTYLVSGGYTETQLIYAIRITITLAPALSEVRKRRRRSIVPVLYDQSVFDVPVDPAAGAYRIEFDRPVRLEAGQDFLVGLESLHSSQTIGGLDGTAYLQYLQCANTTDNVYDDVCYDVHSHWTDLENEFFEAGCAQQRSALFKLHRLCLQIASETPVVKESPTSPNVNLFDNFSVRCRISGTVERRWKKVTSRGDVLPFPASSPILRFEQLSTEDQGTYYCEGVGGGDFQDVVVTTEPFVLALQDVITLSISVTFNTTYIDIDDPAFASFKFQYQSQISDAFLPYQTLTPSLVTPGPKVSFYEAVIIVNTRPGSLIVDYQVGFESAVWNNQTNLIDTVTNAIETHALNSLSGPSIVPGSISVSSISTCPSDVVFGNSGTLTFPAGIVNQYTESVERCADYTGNYVLPRAIRFCSGDFVSTVAWADPVLTNCFEDDDNADIVLADIADTTVSSDNVTSYSSDLASATNDTSTITSDGLDAVAKSLQNIVQVGDASEEVTVNVINTVNNILGVDEEEYVMSIDVEAPTRILDSLEEQVTLFQTSGLGTNITLVSTNIAVVAIQVPKSTVQSGIGFASNTIEAGVYDLNENTTMVYYDTGLIPQNEAEAAIVLPSGILDLVSANKSDTSMVPVSFFVFQSSKLFQSRDQADSTPEEVQRQAVGSRVISATIEGVTVVGLPLGQEVETTFLELNVTDEGETVDTRSCVFWEKTPAGGLWSTEGCRREDDPNINRIRCLCDHLTSFAVLLDISGDINYVVLDIISMIGCIVSIVCLTIMLITFLCVKRLRSRQPQRIHINLCVALLCLYLVFVVGIERRHPWQGCVTVGFLIHYFMLASMAWMLVEAVYMYKLFVTVHSGTVSKFLRIASVFAWGTPAIPCIIIVCIDMDLYLGDGTYCFVQPGPALYYGTMLPVAAILLANFTIFILVTYRLTCGRWAISGNKSTAGASKAKKRSETWRLLQDLFAFTILLGLTWVFGFLAIGGARFLFNVLFLVCNSLQGLAVFLMFGVRQKVVRDEWVRCMCCRCGDEKAKGSKYSAGIQKPRSTGNTNTTSNTGKSDIMMHSQDHTNTTSISS